MKKELENAPPEPREPAAREAAFTFAVAQGVTDGKYLDMQLVGEKFGGLFAFMEAYSAELRAAAQSDYQRVFAEGIRWHDRAEAAETSLLQARKDVAHWKANHDDQKRRKQNVSRKLSELIKKNMAKKASTSAPEGTV